MHHFNSFIGKSQIWFTLSFIARELTLMCSSRFLQVKRDTLFRWCYYIDNKEKRIFKRNKNGNINTLTLDKASHSDRFFISCCTSLMDLRQFNDSSNRNVVSFINMFTNRMKSFEELCFKMAFLWWSIFHNSFKITEMWWRILNLS